MRPFRSTLIGAAMLFSSFAGASDYPTQQITMIVPLAPGGLADLVARAIQTPLQVALGKPVIIENRPGGGGAVGAVAVARGKPDGHTLLLALSPTIGLPEMDRLDGKKPSYELTELTPIARLTAEPFVVLVRPDAPWKSFADVVEDARKRPNAISFASSGTRGSIHFAVALAAHAANVSFLHVPYRGGGPAVTALLSKDVDFTLAAPSVAAQFVDSGQLRAIARSGGDEPLKLYPKLTSFKEQGINAEYTLWSALYAPVATPADVQEKLRTTLRAIYADPAFQKAADGAGLDLKMLQGADLKAFHEREEAATNKLIHIIGKI